MKQGAFVFEADLFQQWKNAKSELPNWLSEKLKDSISMSTEERDSLYSFCVKHGYSLLLLQHCLKLLMDSEGIVPWPYFFEALAVSKIELSEETIAQFKNLIRGATQQRQAIRSSYLNGKLSVFQIWQEQAGQSTERELRQELQAHFDELHLFRAQQLVEKERETLQLLQKKYPLNEEVKDEVAKYQERYAEEIIHRVNINRHRKPHLPSESTDPADMAFWQKLVHDWLRLTPLAASDIIVACLMMDLAPLALQVWQSKEQVSPWLGATVLLENQRYVELLALLPTLENQGVTNSETFFASSYLRAQAYWGLGQKEKAVEIMEALLVSQPDYRSAREILETWRSLA